MSEDEKKKSVVSYFGIVIAITTVLVAIIIWQYPNPAPMPDFSISVNPMQGSVQQGSLTQTTVDVKGINNYEYPVILSTVEQSSDLAVAFIPQSGEAAPGYASNMTINISPNAPAEDHTITIKGMGSDGKERFCKYNLKVIPKIYIDNYSTAIVTEAYMVYSDVGIASGDVWVWSGADWGLESPRLVEFNYSISDAPEGKNCFAVTGGSGQGNYIGWGVFLGIFENHKLITPHIVDLSEYKNLSFWVKTPVNLKVEIQENNPQGRKSSSCLISNYGWDNSSSDSWQKITIPKSSFRNVDLTEIFSPFMITGNGSRLTFYVDEVMWTP